MTLTEQLTEVCRMLRGYGYEFVVGGGFARDIACGMPPKDADICVYGSAYGPIESYGIPQAMGEWALENGLCFQQIPSYGMSESDFDQRCAGVAKIGDVDIIFYRFERSWQGILNKFDFNINQFYFPSSIPEYSGKFDRDPQAYLAREYNPSFNKEDVAYFGNVEILRTQGLGPIRTDYSQQREAYMKLKYLCIKQELEEWLNEHYPIQGTRP